VFALSGAVTMDTDTMVSPGNQQFIIESAADVPSAGFATSNDPNATQKCSIDAPCPQQLEIAFDTLNQQPATLGTPNAIFATNSLNDPDVISQIVITNPCVAATATTFTVISVLNEDNTFYNFFLSGGNGINPCLANSSSPATGTYCLGPDNGDCTNETESGAFNIYAMPDPSAEYFGTFNSGGSHSKSPSGLDSLTIQVNSDFSVTSTLLISSGDLCAAQTTPLLLTSTDPDAVNNADYGNGIGGIIVGDVLAIAVADDLGNVLAVLATDRDANDNPLPAGSLYVSGTVISGVCGSGAAFFDKPFASKIPESTPHPRRPRHPRPRHRWYMTKYMHEFDEKTENREQLPPFRFMFPVLRW
jgi:hypothetical protein